MKSLAVYEQLGLLALSPSGAGTYSPGPEHVFHHHHAMWSYCHPGLARPFASDGMLETGPNLFSFPEPGTSLAHAAGLTRLLVFLGAHPTEQMRAALARKDSVCLVFEPDLERLASFLDGYRTRDMAGKGVFFVAGDPDRLPTPLLQMLPENLTDMGYPLFFAAQGLPETLPGYVHRVEELIELFYYRNVLYNLEGQDNIRGFPLRPMARNATYDRVKHLYENLTACLRSGTLSDILDTLPGSTAILCAAGPALRESLDFIRRNQDRAVVIAVNSALKPLLAAGIEPHFTVINDTSTASETTLADLPTLPNTLLVAHCLASSGGKSFPRSYFFGNFPGQPFPKRDSLLLHGSVITTAFSLAEYLGCSKAVLAGVQLSSPNPTILNYASGTLQQDRAADIEQTALTHRWPQLYPATAADGSQVYTTLNFFDSAQWFADRIRMSSLEVINLCPMSILRGPGIVFDPSPVLADAPNPAGLIADLPATDFTPRADRVREYIAAEMGIWKAKERSARQVMAEPGAAAEFIRLSDEDNSSFMLQRFEDFDNHCFHQGYFESASPEQRMETARHFCDSMRRMAKSLLDILKMQLKRLG